MSVASLTSSSTYTTYLSSLPYIPLTTTFTPSAQCASLYANGTNGLAIYDPFMTCLPTGYTIGTTNFFSPGISCPSGYWTAGSDTIGASSMTTITCCPSRGNISLAIQLPTGANGDYRDTTWATYFCLWTPGPRHTVTLDINIVSNSKTTLGQSVFSPGLGINAYEVRMVHQSSDIVVTTTSGTSITSITAAPTGTTTLSSPSATGTSGKEATSSGGLSPGATIAIAVVIPVIGLVLLGALYVWWWKKKRGGHGAPAGQAELQANDPRWRVSELKGLPTEGPLSELPVPVMVVQPSGIGNNE